MPRSNFQAFAIRLAIIAAVTVLVCAMWLGAVFYSFTSQQNRRDYFAESAPIAPPAEQTGADIE